MKLRIVLIPVLALLFARSASGGASGYNSTNIALGRPLSGLTNTVQGSSSNINDGLFNTWYSYESTGTLAYHATFTIDLGSTYSIGKINFFAAQTSAFSIWSSTNGTDWTLRHNWDWTVSTGLTTPTLGPPVTLEPNGSYSARYIRYEGRAKWMQYVGMNEFEVYEWTGTPTPPSLAGLANLAAGKTAANAPSPYTNTSNHGPSLLTDSNTSTYWQGNYVYDNCVSIYNASLCPLNHWFGTSGYVSVDLGSSQTIQAVRLLFPSGVTGAQSMYITFTDSADGSNIKGWATWGDPSLIATSSTSTDTRTFYLSAPVTARYVWVNLQNWVSTVAMPTSLSEIEVYGTLPAPITGPYQFVPVTPCRIVDTRNATGTFGGPSMTAGSSRDFPVPSSSCGIPSSATAYALNVTVVPKGPFGYLTIWPSGSSRPVVSTLNSLDGRVKANAAIVPAGTGGGISVFVTDNTELILDINGYFKPASSNTLQFYPMSPCRIMDTRNATGPLGAPSLAPLTARTVPVLSSPCGIPSAAQAYSLNATVVPKGPFGYLTIWPTGATQPLVSTLNAVTGTVTANAAIVPAGTGGSINVYGTDNTELILDINGYFAPTGVSSNGLSFYTVAPCRISDTRNTPNGSFAGPAQAAVTDREYPMASSACLASAGNAAAYSINATVVPSGPMGFLTLWPASSTRPTVSTLNALDGAITSNAAIVVGGGTASSIQAYTTDTTHLLIDINGVFKIVLN